MPYCYECGARCEDYDKHCPKCGAKLKSRALREKLEPDEKLGIISLITAVVSLLLTVCCTAFGNLSALIVSIAGLVTAIATLIMSSIARRRLNEFNHLRSFATAGYVIGMVSLVLSIAVVSCNSLISFAGCLADSAWSGIKDTVSCIGEELSN